MERKFKRIGVLTSGGDAPGMNAAIRSVVIAAHTHGIEVMGIYEGYKGLMENNMKLLRPQDVIMISNKGGTILKSARCDEFKYKEGVAQGVRIAKENNLDGIVCIGGDGTFRGALDLTRSGIPCIGVTGTIDNDVSASDYTVGFDTAKNTALESADKLIDTCESHARCNIIKVMGRDAGYIAVETAIASEATGCIVREIPFGAEDEAALIAKIIDSRKNHGKRNFIVIVSEGYSELVVEPLKADYDSKYLLGYDKAVAKKIKNDEGKEAADKYYNECREAYFAQFEKDSIEKYGEEGGKKLAEAHRNEVMLLDKDIKNTEYCKLLLKRIEKAAKEAGIEVETKFAELAHVQRGGSPTIRDRVAATEMGAHAVELLIQGKSNLIVTENDGVISGRDIEWALAFDSVYKNKATPEALAKIEPTILEDMRAVATIKHKKFEERYALANKNTI